MKSNKLTYDLTTKEGLKTCLNVLGQGPFGFIVGKLISSIFESKSTEKQAQIVEKLIVKGKEEGVDEMEIIIDNSKGIDFGVPVENTEIKAKIGADEKTHIKVKYK